MRTITSILSSFRPFLLRGMMVMLTVIPASLFSQGEFNIWYFGQRAGIDFNSGSPVILTNCNNSFYEDYVSVSVSDSLGNLLFYADASRIYNRNHQPMPNGSYFPIMPGVEQPLFIVKKIDDDSTYYIFSMDESATIPDPFPSGLRYSIIDMRLDGGLGDIVPGEKYIPVPGAEQTGHVLYGTRHRNNKDAWIIVRKYNNSNQFLSYLITPSGISTVPVISTSLTYLYPLSSNDPNMIRISPDGSKMVCLYDSLAEFGDFNTTTGVFTPFFRFNYFGNLPISEESSAEFSIDSKYLYIASFAGSGDNYLTQYDASTSDSLQFVQTASVISHSDHLGGLQMGPDGKIYMTNEGTSGTDSLSVINYPSLSGFACNYQFNSIYLQGRKAFKGLCDFLQRYYVIIHHDDQCQGLPVAFTSSIWPPPDSIHWDFGDPASGPSNYSDQPNPIHIYMLPGTYTTTLIVRHIDKRFDTAWAQINIFPIYTPQLGPNQTICAGDSITFDAGACVGCTFVWTDLIADTIVSTSQTFTTGFPGIYTVKVTNIEGCKGFDTIQLFTTAPPVVTTTPLFKSICSGDSTRIPLSANIAGTTFSWSVTGSSLLVSGFSPGTGDTINQRLVSSSTVDETVTYWITPTAGNCAGDSVAYVVTVSPGDSVGITIAASANPVCEGTLVTFTATPVNEGISPIYQWQVNGLNVGANNPVFSYVPVTSDQVTCVLTSSETVCITNNPATSNTIIMTVNPNNLVNVTISPSANPVCSGVSVTFTAFPQYGGSSPTYQWQVNGINTGSNSPSFTYSPVNNDIVTCILTSSETVCVTNNPATSNQVIMTVNPNLPVSVTISPSANPVCAGSSVTFTATPDNEGLSPVYQWKVNGTNVGSNSTVYTYTPLAGDLVSCILTSSETVCVTNNPATSNTITMNVNPKLPVSVSIAASANPVCSGTPVTFTATPVNEGATPSYQWKVNGINSGLDNPVFVYTPVNNDVILCVLTSSETVCVSNNPATSNAVTMIVNPVLPVSITIAASANPVCSGTSVTFTAIPVNGGTLPVYQWKVNGVMVGTNSPVYTYSPASGDLVSCILTSNATCAIGNPATSNTITMTVASAPVVTFSACFDTMTTVNAKPIKLRGGIPLGGSYTGAGVSGGIFYPALAGPGIHVITYTYTNAASCFSSDNLYLHVLSPPAFTCGSLLVDIRDSKAYPTVQLGGQCWMAANLNYGLQITGVTDQRDNCVNEKYCYNDIPVSCQQQGALYQWDEMMKFEATAAIQGLCPPAWHVPTEAEWNTLFAVYINNAFAGSPLKYSGYSGFNALMSGIRAFNKTWNYNGFATFFWSSTAWSSTKAWAHAMNDYDPSVAWYPSYRTNAFSVRCVKD